VVAFVSVGWADARVIAANEMPQAVKRDLAQQVWCMIPARSKDHPAPFPERLPARLIRLFAMMSATAGITAGITAGNGDGGRASRPLRRHQPV
jgi:hypothetical protein